jgi:hypothetical protein
MLDAFRHEGGATYATNERAAGIKRHHRCFIASQTEELAKETRTDWVRVVWPCFGYPGFRISQNDWMACLPKLLAGFQEDARFTLLTFMIRPTTLRVRKGE